MIADPMERLRAANPEPWCPAPPIDDVWRRIEAEDRPPQGRAIAGPGGRKTRRGLRRRLPDVLVALTSLVLVIAVGAIALLAHGRGTPAASSAGAKRLIARLAVLRRPQTAADKLPNDLRFKSPLSPTGKIIPQLTRLVHTTPDARFYLVVTTWSPDSTWPRRLGDQVGILEISGNRATESMPIPAVDLSNAKEVWYVSPTKYRQRPFTQRGAYFVGVVPDGVARARWTFRNFQSGSRTVLGVTVSDNVAISRAQTGIGQPVLRAAWYAPDGQRVATSDRAQLAAQAAQQAKLKAQTIRYILQHPYRAAPSLLAAFAVFDTSSPTGVKTEAGDTISRPQLSSLPLDVLLAIRGWISHPPGIPIQPDPTEVREVLTPSGARLYVIPGRRALCLHVVSRSASPGAPASGGGTCNPLPDVESHGLFLGSGANGVSRIYRLLPKTIHTLTVHLSGGTRKVPVPDGIYVSPWQPARQPPLRPCPYSGRPCPVR